MPAFSYRWRAFYSGDVNNAPANGPCGAPNEIVVVAAPPPPPPPPPPTCAGTRATIVAPAGGAAIPGTRRADVIGGNGLTRRLPVALALSLGVMALAPQAANAGASMAVGPSVPANVTVGSTGVPLSLSIANISSNGPGETNFDTDTFQIDDIAFVASCGSTVFSADCAAGSQDAGVLVPSPLTATGRAGTACAGRIFTISLIDAAQGKYRFTPDATVLLGPSAGPVAAASCSIDFTSSVPRAPAIDSTPSPGLQTEQKAFAAVEDIAAGSPNFGLTAGGIGTSQTTVARAQGTIATQASANVALGGTLSDQATVSGLVNPIAGATVEFRLYGPNDATCASTAAFTSVVPLALSTGNTQGTASSAPFTPTSPGTYRWRAIYSGDANNAPATGTCNDVSESSVVTRATPTIVTQATPDVALGESVTDTATVIGRSNPGLTRVTFRLYGPSDPTCAGTPVFSSFVSYPVAGGPVTSTPAFTPTQIGTYRWIAEYSGDANNEPATGACNAPGESTTVTPAPTGAITTSASASIALGGTVSDSAAVTGLGAPSATATITFRLYGPNDAACAGAPVFASTVAYPAAGGAVSSAPYTPTSAGTYRWIASYSGDVNNAPIAGACNAAGESVVVAPARPAIATVASAGVVLGAGTLTDSATVTGRVSPLAGATVTFRLYGPTDPTCAGAPVFASAVPYPVAGGPVTSAPYTPTAAGTHRWRATYSGDANNAPTVGTCDDPREAVTVTEAAPVPAGLDHFKCYVVQKHATPKRVVTLDDQFATRTTNVFEARQLCNPVRKTHGQKTTKITHPSAHLVCRRTTNEFGTAVRDVLLRNQFGVVRTRTTRAQTLCVPSLKRVIEGNGKPVPPDGSNPELVLDHFRCYGVQPRQVSLTVKLRDQFGLSDSKVIRLVRLCNPVRKTYKGKDAKIKRPRAHLACYTIDDGTSLRPRKVVVRNQFGVSRLRVTRVETLCLPTSKRVLGVPDVWGMDNASDTGSEPSGGQYSLSPDIRVRNTLGDGQSEEPKLGLNHVYVTVRNRGTAAVTSVKVLLYANGSGTGNAWPMAGWGLIGTAFVASLNASDDVVVEIPWTVTRIFHRCLFALMMTPDDPIGPMGVPSPVQKYNAVLQRNVNYIDLIHGAQTAAMTTGNVLAREATMNLRFEAPRTGPDTFLDHGTVVADLSALARDLKRKGVRLRGMVRMRDSRYRIADPNAAVLGLPMKAHQKSTLSLRFEQTEAHPGTDYNFDVIQEYAATGEMASRSRADRNLGSVRYVLPGG